MVTASQPIRVDIWSDVVCPWCYIGKRRFERALGELDGEVEVEFAYHAFQLDPTASPGKSQPVAEAYARKFGGPERAREVYARVEAAGAKAGIDLHFDRIPRTPNTMDAHRLIRWSRATGHQSALVERLYKRLA